ncbi:MAG: serine protease [Oscillatoriales cyanobacterium]|nr:MAG: serine protease [Oscillatoriales cyanobacterium]
MPISLPIPGGDVENLARQATIRIKTSKSSGSGAIVQRQGQTYTVLTSWHVVAFDKGDRTIVTSDGLIHQLLGVPQRLGDADLAIAKFRSAIEYKVAPIGAQQPAVGEPLLAAGFPAETGALAVAQGFVELLLPKSEDGSEPTPELLEKMVKSSWGIPISTYLQFVSSHPGS